MSLSHRENYLRNASMTGPGWMPCVVAISGASWDQLREDLEDVLMRHPTLFPGFQKGQCNYDDWDPGPAHRAGQYFRDAWDCVWHAAINGLEGVVVESPLLDWSKLDAYRPPNPLAQGDRGPTDWERTRQAVAEAKRQGHLTSGGVPHGFFFMRLFYLRGFENLMLDIATGDSHLPRLCEMLLEHNQTIVWQWLDMGVDIMEFADDLGMQNRSVLSQQQFHRWITPAYKSLMEPCRRAGLHVGLHSDGYIMNLMDEFVEAGVTIINPQDLVNGIDNLACEVKGRMCIRLDIDRQKIVPFGTRKEIHDLIEEEVRKLGSPQGGLEMIAGIYPPTPAENVDALCEAMEKFRTYWWE